ncbi:polyphosphate kinase 2 family protein [Pseudonocardiaceae bacterium YIM PH 21723]|nr:polyphosphate kinase 2 family protein [Pseudonocardiaceae bacterium YIM PH 21723]
MGKSVREEFRVPTGGVDLGQIDPAGRPMGPKDKDAALEKLADTGDRLDELQERLYAEGNRRVLLVLQGMDTSGKGGTIRHVAGTMNPQGLRIASFKKPTEEELQHDFLWRIRKEVPAPGTVGIFDRSHYEDVLIARVDKLVPRTTWQRRFAEINEFEAELAENGVTVLKCFLHISPERQLERLRARLENPEKYWKYNPADLDGHAKWSAYQAAYTDVLRRCSTDDAPWYVIPSDRKWYRNWVVARLLLETLTELDPRYPVADFDPAVELARIDQA